MQWVKATQGEERHVVFVNIGTAMLIRWFDDAKVTRIAWAGSKTDVVTVNETPQELFGQMLKA